MFLSIGRMRNEGEIVTLFIVKQRVCTSCGSMVAFIRSAVLLKYEWFNGIFTLIQICNLTLKALESFGDCQKPVSHLVELKCIQRQISANVDSIGQNQSCKRIVKEKKPCYTVCFQMPYKRLQVLEKFPLSKKYFRGSGFSQCFNTRYYQQLSIALLRNKFYC